MFSPSQPNLLWTAGSWNIPSTTPGAHHSARDVKIEPIGALRDRGSRAVMDPESGVQADSEIGVAMKPVTLLLHRFLPNRCRANH